MDKFQQNSLKAVIRPKNLSFQIKEQLLDAITKGVFTVGDYLPSENKLVEIFHTSRGVVREALLMLSAKGLIEIKKGKGAKIIKPSVESLFDSFSLLVNHKCGDNGLKYTQEVRRFIEPQIAAIAAQKRNDRDIKKLENCIAKMEENKENINKLSYYDIEYHKIIWAACGNPMFPIILEPIVHFLQTYHKNIFYNATSKLIDTTFEDHIQILNAIKNNDAKSATKIMKKHLIYS